MRTLDQQIYFVLLPKDRIDMWFRLGPFYITDVERREITGKSIPYALAASER